MENMVNVNKTFQQEKIKWMEKLVMPRRWKPWGPQIYQSEDPGWLKHKKRSIKMGMPWSMEEDVEGRNGKQWYDNVLSPAESVVKKQRENTEEIGTNSSLHHTC